ncbi:iron ABC transporter ATP-binding protein [Naasia lichenicola]|uniref:Iron ABC transporter ATP-binding protein n=1 Tax=Naasia lichenicola TaxID=2565933 RepID=A0A4S4FQ62_9MICO|nr:iron ABC transporter ATP-binding protein [Naasia lichenicola]THG31506.1 iron ABC transporter ATP-binding protein [Naasia lichenicola]
MSVRTSRWTVVVLGLAVASVALAGCTSNPVQPAPQQTTTAPPVVVTEPSQSTTPEPEPTATQEPGIPVVQTCDQLITPDELYAFNPNVGVNPAYQAETGTTASRIVSLQGVACGWSNQTSNETIEIAVAHLSSTAIEGLKNELALSSTPVPTYGDEAYFEVNSGLGEANVFSGDYWIYARSTTFLEPGDAAMLMDDVMAALTA